MSLGEIRRHVGKPDAYWLKAIQDPSGKSRGRFVVVAIHLPTEPHTVITNTGDLDHRTTSDTMKVSSNAIRPQVTTRDSHITKENKMSRRGIHPLLRGHGQPKRETAPRHPAQKSGLESGQRKRYLRCLEAEQAEMSSSNHD